VPGGTHLQFIATTPSASQYRLLLSWLVLTVLARVLGTHPEMESVGLGPFETRLSRALARLTCLLQRSITVRDVGSVELLTSWGVKTELVDDLAISYLQHWRRRIGAVRVPDDDPPYLLAAPAFARCDPGWWAEHLRDLSVASGARRIVFLASGSQSGGDDLDAISRIMKRLKLDETMRCQTVAYRGDVDGTLRLIDGARGVVAARYHVVLTARAFGKPVVADVYHPKVVDAMKVEPIG